MSGFELNSRDSKINILWFFLPGTGFGGGTVCRQLMKYEKDCNKGALSKNNATVSEKRALPALLRAERKVIHNERFCQEDHK